MLTVTLISLPPETIRQMVERDSAHAGGGGSASERRAGLAVLMVVLLAEILAFVLH